jgi:hypothetical protein
MADSKVWTLFYGSFINLDVLKQVGYIPDRFEVARLSSFDIRNQPLAKTGLACTLVETLDGKLRAECCYIAPRGEPRPATNDYIDRIVIPGRQHGFPEWYIARLET